MQDQQKKRPRVVLEEEDGRTTVHRTNFTNAIIHQASKHGFPKVGNSEHNKNTGLSPPFCKVTWPSPPDVRYANFSTLTHQEAVPRHPIRRALQNSDILSGMHAGGISVALWDSS